jgi:hypothetical protein
MAKKLTPLPKLLKKAQTIFNKWIRERDKEKSCISCGGKVEQAGHYFSQKNYSGLRFDETNVHGQCVRCNMYLSGNLIEYGMGLVDRYGTTYHIGLLKKGRFKTPKKWSREELIEIIKKYK